MNIHSTFDDIADDRDRARAKSIFADYYNTNKPMSLDDKFQIVDDIVMMFIPPNRGSYD